jgi:gamma-glutamyltranspeptidase / glutathione hydrolase
VSNRELRLVLLLVPSLVSAQDRSQARSMVITPRGIVATAQTLASQAGAQILARGGSAVDAAIAANAVLSVLEPMMNGPGGDLFALVWDAKTSSLIGINASGWAPKALSIEYLKKQNMLRMPTSGIHTVTVPGCVAGWEKLHKRFGKLPWRDLFRPAVYYAENGFPVTELIQWDWENTNSRLGVDARKVYLPNGTAPKVGETFRNPQLGHAFRLIAELGAKAFYDGPVGEALLATSRKLGGTLTAADLSEFEPEWVQPISTDYRGWKVSELPPNGQGIGTLEMLNILESFPIGQHDPMSVEALHLKIEAEKLAFADLDRYVGDPKFAAIPVAGLLSKPYARQRASLIDPDKARCDAQAGSPADAHGNTTYLSTVDKEGNTVSLIQSNSEIFGSGILIDGMGILLHDRGSAFTLDADHPNALAPRKRPYHTIIPAFMEQGSQHIAFGIMRGVNQPQAQMQFVTNIADHKMNIQAALEAPRFTKPALGGCELLIESRVPEIIRAELERKGHRLDVVGDFSGLMGGGQAVLHDSAAKMNYGASSPRKDGAAIPEPDPYFK